ncbi:MAG: YggS family pyridoxal phosphate-dependent enzyme [Mariprofundaceae bacterium]
MSTTESKLISRWQRLHHEMDESSTRMLAVSKYHSDEEVRIIASCGQRDFAESRPQALRDRVEKFPDLNWHMIGPVQKNKAKYVGRHAFMWHSLSSFEVAEEVVKHVSDRVLPVLLQVNISGEDQKYGVAPEDVGGLLEKIRQLDSLKVIGLMGMAAKFDGDDSDISSDAVRSSFRTLRNLRDHLGDASLRELCMGMSGDFRIAIEEGATMVRLGTVLFGSKSI